MENGWELTSELTSKWITFNNTQSNFTQISLITFAVIIQLRQIYRAIAVIPADGACKITWKTVENWRLNWRLNEITFKNTQSNFTPISLLTFAVIIQTSSNYRAVAVIPADGACKTTWKTVENWRLNWRLNE